MRARWTAIGSGLAALLATATVAGAQEYCVSCTEPAALYRCVIDNPRPGATPSLQVLCLTTMAHEGKHGQCTVLRGVTVFQCDGPVRRVSLPPEIPAGPPGQTAAAPSQPAATPAQPQGEPKTLVELAKRAKDQSDQQWKNAGENWRSAGEKTGQFFKNAFNCIGSLFTKCTSE
ncbi:MAG: hypothetical protein KGP27_18130 [Hyphomicrobiales bacterium]|nr:hypothetical protein [Hyphomicrobiales bacterium]